MATSWRSAGPHGPGAAHWNPGAHGRLRSVSADRRAPVRDRQVLRSGWRLGADRLVVELPAGSSASSCASSTEGQSATGTATGRESRLRISASIRQRRSWPQVEKSGSSARPIKW